MIEILLAAGWLATIIGFLLYLRDRDAGTERERASLLNRIQAPEIEVAKQFEAPTEPAYLGFDDDEGFNRYKEELTRGGS